MDGRLHQEDLDLWLDFLEPLAKRQKVKVQITRLLSARRRSHKKATRRGTLAKVSPPTTCSGDVPQEPDFRETFGCQSRRQGPFHIRKHSLRVVFLI